MWSRDVSVRCRLVSPEQHFSRGEGIDSVCLAVCLDLAQPDALTRRRGLRRRTRREAEHMKACASSRAPRAARVRVVLFMCRCLGELASSRSRCAGGSPYTGSG